ncbi:hypothetical protein, partial [Nocardia xishanensis]
LAVARLRHAQGALAHDSLTSFAHACASLSLGFGMRKARWHMIRSLRSLMPAPRCRSADFVRSYRRPRLSSLKQAPLTVFVDIT